MSQLQINELVSSQAFGLTITMLLYITSDHVYRKTKLPILNPLLITSILLMAYVKLFGLDVNSFLTDLSGINVFLGPLIVCLAVPIVKQMDLIKKNYLVIIVSSFVAALTAIFSVILIGPLLGLDKEVIASLVPKSSTTPIAIEVSKLLGGIRAITVAVVVISAVLGTIIIPFLIKLTKITDPLIIGMTLGTTSQAVGTAKALEIHPEAGAISGVALVITALFTALISLFL